MFYFLIFFCGLLLGVILGVTYIYFRLSKQYIFQINDLKHTLDLERKHKEIAKAELEALKKYNVEKTDDLKGNIDAFISKAVLQNNRSFIELAGQTLDKLISKSDDNFARRTAEMKNMIDPLRINFERHESVLKNFEVNNSNSFGNLKSHLEQLVINQKSLEKETSALVNALKAPKVRGRWGEIGLRRIVEFSGMSEYCHFEEQVSVAENTLRPDMLVKLPDSKQIVVDAKVPLNAYLNAMETSDDAERKSSLQRHTKSLMGHVKDLSSKSYWKNFDNAVDFVILYIEVEPAFGAALHENKNLIEDALRNRIIIATPTTLITMLQTIAYSWRQHKATENAMKIWKLSKELYERMSVFSEYFQKTGQSIENLTKTYNAAVGSWESRIIPGIKKIEQQGIDSSKKIIVEPQKIETNVRNLNVKNRN